MKRYHAIKNLLLVAFVLIGKFTFSQLELAEDKVKATFSIEQKGCEAFVVAKVTCVPHWHINAVKLPAGSFGFPTSLTLKKSADFKMVGGTIEPKPKFVHDDMADEDLFFHEGTFTIKQKIAIVNEKDFTIEGSFGFQTCNEVKCLPDASYPFKLKVKGCVVEEEKTEVVSADIEKEFVINKNGIGKDKGGNEFVKVRNKWHKVPKGNSSAFYKKYLEIKKEDEK